MGRAGVLAAALALTAGPTAVGTAAGRTAPTALLADDQCVFGGPPLPGKPWALQRVLLDQVWTYSTGKGVTVAVIDSGVASSAPQLAPALVPGKDFFGSPPGSGDGSTDDVGHGTMAAGIVAARPSPVTGFTGLAPDARIMPVRQNGGTDGEKGTDATLAQAVTFAVDNHAQVVNISQDVEGSGTPGPALANAVADALRRGVVVVAAAGNSGDKDNGTTYPAAYPGVLAVGASDRSNDRAPFSQDKDYVGVLAPGVDMWSTVPGGGHCRGDGTSFAAPYVSGVAALLRSAHPDWSPAQVVTVIEQTAQRPTRGPVTGQGWGVVDPLQALEFSGVPGTLPVADTAPAQAAAVRVAPLHSGPTRADEDRRTATVVAAVAVIGVLLLACGAFTLRDLRARRAA